MIFLRLMSYVIIIIIFNHILFYFLFNFYFSILRNIKCNSAMLFYYFMHRVIFINVRVCVYIIYILIIF